MDLVDALARSVIPFSEALIDIADTCSLCGACEIQCHFYSGLRPLSVMAALKDVIRDRRRAGGDFFRPPRDSFVEDLRAISGPKWVSNDPAVLLTYAHDPFPFHLPQFPRAVMLPGSADEVAEALRIAARQGIDFAVRGNGSSVYGQVFSDGLVLDMARMKEISFDTANWSVTVGPGVTSFELQREASLNGFRINAAEPAATVIGNIICTGLFSPWSAAYGMGADHILDMEVVDRSGEKWRISDPDSPGTGLLDYRHRVQAVPGVCTCASIRLHPVTGDEEGLIVPFAEFDAAVRFTRELSARRIGLAIALLGPHYISSFLSPDLELSKKVRAALSNVIGLGYGVHVVADQYGLESVRRLAPGPVIDQRLFRTLALGLPRLIQTEALDLLQAAEGERAPYEILAAPETLPLLEAVLDPSPETLASAVEPDLRDAYQAVYRQPRFTDMAWLDAFRIVSARMGRHKHIIAFILFTPLDQELLDSICARFRSIAEENSLDHDYGFLTPIDMGKRAVLEYDYYIDQTDAAEKERLGTAMAALEPWLDGLSSGPDSNMTWLKTVFTQGTARKESWFYRNLAGRQQL